MLLEFDLAGAEWVVVAYLCQDENMLGVVKSGKSPHVVTGSRMSGVSEEIVEQDEALTKKLKDPAEIAAVRRDKLPEILGASFLPRTMSIRQAAKKGNHGGNYREGFRMFALTNEMDEAEAKKILDRYTCQSTMHGRFGHACGDVAYPKIRDWWENVDATVKETRTLTNCFERKVYFMGQVDEELFKKGYAFMPQSTVVDISLTAMKRVMDDPSPEFMAAKLLAQVHDSLLFEYPSTDFGLMARFVHKLTLDYLSPTLNYGEPFKLGVTMKVGMTWKDLKPVMWSNGSEQIPVDITIDEIADQLHKAWVSTKDALAVKRAAALKKSLDQIHGSHTPASQSV